MTYYDTGEDFGGLDLYVGHGFDDPIEEDIIFYSMMNRISTAWSHGRIEISSRDLLLGYAQHKMLQQGIAYGVRKGMLDATLFGARHAAIHLQLGTRMTMNRMIVAGTSHLGSLAVRGAFGLVRSLSPHALFYGALYGTGRYLQSAYQDLSGMYIGDIRFSR